MASLSNFKVGDVLLTYGMDMGCHKCVVTTKVVAIDERGIITKSDEDDCLILHAWRDMEYYNDYFLYSEEQEKAMQQECDNEYNAWVEACRKQAERAHKSHMERNERMKNTIKEKGYFDGTHTIFELSGKTNFFRWKKYDILHINENLDLFGMAEDGDTMYVNIDDLAVPSYIEIESELKAA